MRNNNGEIMINRKRIKYINTYKLKKCHYNAKNIANKYGIKKNKCQKKVNLKKIIYLTLVFPIVTFFSFQFVSIIPFNTNKIIFKYLNCHFGQKILLKDDSEYYCIGNCDFESRKIKLLKVEPLDINNDYKIDENDKIEFDLSNSNIYDISSKNNIGYFLNNLNKKSKLDKIEAFRLLTSEEYIYIRNTMNFGYDWDSGNWLANKKIDSWWLQTSIVKRVFAVTSRGTYKLSSPNEKNYVRPVIITYKDNIK